MTDVTPHQAADVIIVGAGLAGLTAGYTLARSGMHVVVLEARDRVGGRTLTHSDDRGPSVDLGATWSWPHQTRIRHLAQTLGVARFEQYVEGDAMLDLGPQGTERHAVRSPMAGALRFEHGAEQLSTRLTEVLPAGSVKCGVQVTGVHVQEDLVLVMAAVPAGDALIFPAQAVIVALPPRLVGQSITFMPELPSALTQVLSATPTWMGHAMKAVVRYDRAFWRAQGLSGFAVSYTGPLQEIHDASPADGGAGALFGFVTTHDEVRRASPKERQHLVLEQLGRLFGPAAALPRSYEEVDWTRERRSSTAQDEAPPKVFPAYGHPLLRESALNGRLFWAGAETSPLEGGLLEGAVQSGEHAARLVLARWSAER